MRREHGVLGKFINSMSMMEKGIIKMILCQLLFEEVDGILSKEAGSVDSCWRLRHGAQIR